MKELLMLTIIEDDDGNKAVVTPADGIDQQTALKILEDFVINMALKFIDDSLSVGDYSDIEGDNDSMDVQ